MQGFDQRYQNGFDCQGLWIEVGVEKQLGLNSKREIEEYGLDGFARKCRDVVVWSTRGADARLEAARPVDGLGQRLLHVQRHEHRVHLAVPEDRARQGLALHRPPLDRVVPALRHVALAARADAVRRLPGPRRPFALRPLPAARPARRVARRLDDDAVDAAGERRGRRQPRGRVRPPRQRRVGRGRALPGRDVRRDGPGRGAGRLAVRGALRHARAGRRRRASRRRRGTRSRWTRARASSTSRPAAAARTSSSGRELGLPVLAPVDEAGHFYDDYGWLHGLSTGRGGRPDRRRPEGARAARRGRPVRAPLPALLALRHAAHLPHRRRLVHPRRRDPAAAARGERDG